MRVIATKMNGGVWHMENQELLQFMKDAIGVETDLATQEQIMRRGCAEIRKRMPQLQLKSLPEAPTIQEASKAIGFVLLGVGSGIALMLSGMAEYGDGLLYALLVGAMLIVPGIIILVRAFTRNARVREERRAHQRLVDQVKEQNERAQQDYDAAIRRCDYAARAFAEAAEVHIAATKDVLEKLYNKGAIYRKYCTLPALTCIYEYFVTERCTELTGPHGAYNLYEDELRKDTVISQLNTVIENLEQIRHNQYMLYQQVKSINENTNTIVSELQQIKGYTIKLTQLTALNAYYAALNERNTRVTMYYHL